MLNNFKEDTKVLKMTGHGNSDNNLEPLCISVNVELIVREPSTTTGYGLDDRGIGVRVVVGARIFSSPRRPDRLWGPPNLLYNG
jgi:hypothetical protein